LLRRHSMLLRFSFRFTIALVQYDIRETYLIMIARINHWWEIARHFTWHFQRQSHATRTL